MFWGFSAIGRGKINIDSARNKHLVTTRRTIYVNHDMCVKTLILCAEFGSYG